METVKNSKFQVGVDFADANEFLEGSVTVLCRHGHHEPLELPAPTREVVERIVARYLLTAISAKARGMEGEAVVVAEIAERAVNGRYLRW